MKSWKRRAVLLGGIVTTTYMGACAYFWANQVELTFLPAKTIFTTPAQMGMAFEEIQIPVGSGDERGDLHGFWVPADNPDAPVFLYLHGNNATIGKNLEHTLRLHQLGYHVLLIDYRGFGKSYGTTQPSESKVYQDAEAAWSYLTVERGFQASRSFIYGHSLGGAVAIELASRHPEAAGLITECTFTCTLDMAALKYDGWLNLLPMDFILNQRFESLKKIGSIKIPVLLIHGKLDAKIPFNMSEQLYAAAAQPKTLLLIEGGGHSDSGSIGWAEYRDAVTDFVQTHLGRET